MRIRQWRLALILAGILTLALAGCDQPSADKAQEEKPAVKVTDPQKIKAEKSGPASKVEKASGPSRIKVSEMEWDAGDVARGEDAVHTFVLKNISKEVVHIKRAKGS